MLVARWFEASSRPISKMVGLWSVCGRLKQRNRSPQELKILSEELRMWFSTSSSWECLLILLPRSHPESVSYNLLDFYAQLPTCIMARPITATNIPTRITTGKRISHQKSEVCWLTTSAAMPHSVVPSCFWSCSVIYALFAHEVCRVFLGSWVIVYLNLN